MVDSDPLSGPRHGRRERQAGGKTAIFVDLDGPVLDVSERYYRVHEAILRKFGCVAGGQAEFWSHKREGGTNAQLLRRSCPTLEQEHYLQTWLDQIETPGFLRYDTIVPGAADALGRLATRYRLYLVTLRQHEAHLRQELESLGLSRLFTKVLCGHSTTIPGWRVKASLIRSLSPESPPGLVIIGDTEVDVLAGKELGLTTVAVTNGIRKRELLEALEPDFIVRDITQLPPLLDAMPTLK